MTVHATAPSRHPTSGFSLVEMLMATAMFTIILGILANLITGVSTSYSRENPRLEALNNANAAMDSLVQVIRMAGNNMDSSTQAIFPGTSTETGPHIRIKSDWNPVDGTLGTNTLEDVAFSTNNGIMYKQEPGDGSPVPLYDHIGSLSFSYCDASNNAIANPNLNHSQITLVKITVTTETPRSPPMTITASVRVRKGL
jgi:prepilin-type N-terminal cleavage/methylation domain-containing protein